MTVSITEIPGWQTLTPEQLREQLLEVVEIPINVQVTFGDIETVLQDDTAAELVTSTVKSAGDMSARLYSAFIALSGNGLNLSLPERQEMIDQLAASGSWPDQVRDAIKAMGVERRTRWTDLGGEGEVPDLATIAQMQESAKLQEFAQLLGQRITAAAMLAAADSAATEQSVRDAAIVEAGA